MLDGRKRRRIVIDTNIFIICLNSIKGYIESKKNYEFIVPEVVIKELKRLSNVKKKEAIVAFEVLQELIESKDIIVAKNTKKPSDICKYWDDDMPDFYILSTAYEKDAILLTGDKIMYFFALIEEVDAFYVDFNFNLNNLKLNNIREVGILSNMPEILVDTSFLLVNHKLILDYLAEKKKSTIAISVHTLVELNKLFTYNFLAKDIEYTIKKYIEDGKIHIISTKIMPSKFSLDWDDCDVHYYNVIIAHTHDLLLLSSDKRLTMIAESKSVRTFHVEEGKYTLQKRFSFELTHFVKYKIVSPFFKGEKLEIKMGKSSNKKSKKTMSLSKFKQISKLDKEYMINTKDDLLCCRRVSLGKLRNIRNYFPENLIRDGDIIILKEELEFSSRCNVEVYIIDLKKEILNTVSSFSIPKIVFTDNIFLNILVDSLLRCKI